MSQEAKVLSIIGILTLVILVVGIFFLNKSSAPVAPLTDVSDQSRLIRGDSFQTATDSAQKKVVLVEFGDFECPACGSAHPVLKQLKADYQNDLNVVFRNFPLPQHKNAEIAAKAAEAAGVQNKFWPMHDMLFENQSEWAQSDNPREIFIQYATEIGLNIEQFQKSLDDSALAQKIDRDINDGNASGVGSTPTFFINGKKVNVLQNFSDLKGYIEDELKK